MSPSKDTNLSPQQRRLLTSNAMAFVLAGGRGSRLQELTDRRAKPAVHFGGNARIIDFPLSNAYNSGIRKMAVATQYKAHSLIRHIQRGWNFFRAERNEYLDILPASQRVSESQWYLGTADAIYQNIDIVDDYKVEYIVVLAGDHIYKMDYGIMLQQHVDTDADVTVGCLTVPREEASAFGVMAMDEEDRIIDFLEKPADPPSIPNNPDESLASMGIYIFNWKQLREILIADAANENSSHDFGHDIIPQLVGNGKAFAHQFEKSNVKGGLETKAYWRDVGTLDSFWKANLDMTEPLVELDLYDRSWPIWTYAEIVPPAKMIYNSEGRRGMAVDSLVAGDCVISGSTVEKSLLFNGTRVHSYSLVKETVVLPHVDIARHVRLTRCVVDSDVNIPKGLVVGENPEEDAKWFRVSPGGVTLITQKMLDERAKAHGEKE